MGIPYIRMVGPGNQKLLGSFFVCLCGCAVSGIPYTYMLGWRIQNGERWRALDPLKIKSKVHYYI